LWIGLLFVLSAGFAREYDGEDLLREPWRLLIPVGASLAASFLLFLVAFGRLFLRREGRPPFFATYRAFLTLFWLTAPLAWLYAIPYERFLSAGAATSANLWTLALVAAWRVALMVRVVSVLTGRGVKPSLFLVMAFADAAALTAVHFMPAPVVSVMGGVRLTESEKAISSATLLVSSLGILLAPVWGIGALTAFFTGQPAWQGPTSSTEPRSVSRAMWILACLSLAIWLPILPWTQAEQQLRAQVERDMKAGRIAEALDVMNAHTPSDFPPHWEPPPRVGYGERTPRLFEVVNVLLAREIAPWVRTCYLDKFRRQLKDRYRLTQYSHDEVTLLVHILMELPEQQEILKENPDYLDLLLLNHNLPLAERETLEALQKGNGKNRSSAL
jgi:hypothetical protein